MHATEKAEIFVCADRDVTNAGFGIVAIREAQGFAAGVESFVGSHISYALRTWGAGVLRPYMIAVRFITAGPLLQAGADFDVFGETGEDGAAFGADAGGDDHAVGFDAA